MHHVVIRATQLAALPLMLGLRLVFVRNKLFRDDSGLDISHHGQNASYVVYANHQSMLDPLIICASLPIRLIWRLMPFRFFVANTYLRGPVKLLIYAMGGFPAYFDADKPYGLDKARSLMASNQTIVIFPPGKRTRERIARRGISALAQEPDAHLIPIHIDWKHRWHCEVHIGGSIKAVEPSQPEHLMLHVYRLPELVMQEV